MKKLIFILCLISTFAFSIDHNSALIELDFLKKDLIVKYKKKLNIDFTDMSKNSKEQVRFFYETLYLIFLSNYVLDVKDVKIYNGNKTENILIFADNQIDADTFKELYLIFSKMSNMKINLLQVPVNTKDSLGIIQELSEGRYDD